MTTLFKNAKLVTENGIYQKDLLIKGEKIEALLDRELPLPERDLEVLDLTGKIILPGVIDAHTHYQLQSRATSTADDFTSGSLAAAAGGVTTFIDYVSQDVEMTLQEACKKRIDEALGHSYIDFSFHQSLYSLHGAIREELQAIKDLGISSVKIFTTYRREGYMFPDDSLLLLFQLLKEKKLLLTVHAEDDAMIMEQEKAYGNKELLAHMHPILRPDESEARAIERLALLGEEEQIPIYIAHLSSKRGYQRLKEARERGAQIYGETTPHYLLLNKDRLSGSNPELYLMTPPLREREDQEALWRGLEEGYIQLVATDHCAFHYKQKLLFSSPLFILPGIPGSETLLPLIYHFGVGEGRIDLPSLAHLLSTAPAKIFGLYPKKGSLLPGADADFVVFDPQEERSLAAENLHSKANYSPYEEFTVRGYPVMTYLRGECVFHGDISERRRGRFVPAKTSSLY